MNRKSCMGFHVNVSDLTLSDLERSSQSHQQDKMYIALIFRKHVPAIGLYYLCSLGGVVCILFIHFCHIGSFECNLYGLLSP